MFTYNGAWAISDYKVAVPITISLDGVCAAPIAPAGKTCSPAPRRIFFAALRSALMIIFKNKNSLYSSGDRGGKEMGNWENCADT